MDALGLLIDHSPYAGLFLLLMLGGIGLPVPEDGTLILGGFLISHGIIKLLPALAVVYPGLLIADSLLYLFGRRFGRAIITRQRFHRILPPERLAALEAKFMSSGSAFILFGRHIAGLRIQLFLVAGIVHLPFGRFLAADAFSSLFTMTLMMGIGFLGGNSLQVIRKDITRIEHLAVVVALTAITLSLLYRYLRKRGGEPRGRA